jgi:hypothetical protein
MTDILKFCATRLNAVNLKEQSFLLWVVALSHAKLDDMWILYSTCDKYSSVNHLYLYKDTPL